MSSLQVACPPPATKVLAIASHVVYGYVGNTMATFVMQALGYEVSAMNTVQFSNHTGYRQFKGRRTPASEIQDLYDGLKQSDLTDFEILLSGYAPSADVVSAIGVIARDLRQRSASRPGRFFWILDPVMGDQGRLYVAEDIVPLYKTLVREADLILPNQFEAELLSGVRITSLDEVAQAIQMIHQRCGTKHVVVTSVGIVDMSGADRTHTSALLTVVGSTVRLDGSARLFKVQVPKIDCFFSGTGDMFAALMAYRLREACAESGLLDRDGWLPDDHVTAVDLPLARATEKILNSMHMVLEKTKIAREEQLRAFTRDYPVDTAEGGDQGAAARGIPEDKRRYLAETKAAEVRVVENVQDIIHPQPRYEAQAMSG